MPSLGPSLNQIDVLHLNEEEAEILAAQGGAGTCSKHELLESNEKLWQIANQLHHGNHDSDDGCAMVLLSMGHVQHPTVTEVQSMYSKSLETRYNAS